MIRVAALTSGRDQPSSRFRVRQHLDLLAAAGVQVTESVPAIEKYRRMPLWPRSVRQVYSGPLLLAWDAVKVATRLPGWLSSWRHDVTWLQKELLPGFLSIEPALKRPLVFDVDDAIWLLPPFGSRATRNIARNSRLVIAGNSFLADYFSRDCQDVHIVPTAIDTQRFAPGTPDPERPFTIGWTGLASNLGYLERIAVPVRRFLDAHRDARLLVVANERPTIELAAPEQLDFRPWCREQEVAAIQEMHVGLMPLEDSDWTRGKCSFKMLQYMSCGVPVIVSPIGMNSEVLDLGPVGLPATRPADWYEALEHLFENPAIARRLGIEGRQIVVRHFERSLIADQLARIFERVAGRRAAVEPSTP